MLVLIMTMKIMIAAATGSLARNRISRRQDQRSLMAAFLSKNGAMIGAA
jgi:hypothetical protein